MKKVLSSLILAFTLLVSAQAFADPSARSMDAIKSKDWQRAEQSLSQDLKENRKDPVAWYFRAQVLNHLQRPDDALKCLDNVVKLDPNFRKDAVNSLRKRLESNSKIVANSKATGQRIVTESSLERKRAEQNDTYARNTTVAPAPSVSVSRSEPVSKPVAPTPVASSTNESNGGGAFLGFMLTLLLIVGGGFFAYSFVSKRSTDKAIQKFIKENIAKLVDAYESLKEKRDFLEISDKKGTYLFERIETLMLDIDQHTRKLKAGNADYDGYAIERTLDEVKTVERKFELKSYDAPVQQPKAEPVKRTVEPTRRYESVPAPRKTEQPRHEYRSERSRDNGHTTIINNGNNGSDFLNTVATTILVNEALNSSHRTREREVVRETPVYQDDNKRDDFDLGSVFGSSSSSSSSIFDDSSSRDDFSFGSGSSDSSSTYSDSSSDDDFKL